MTKESGRNLQFAYKFRSLTKLVAEVIARRRGAARASTSTSSPCCSRARDKESGEPMPERELIDEVLTLIVAGHETTASGLNWTWYLLSQHPQVDARLHAELDAAPESRAPSLAQMEALTYTQQVINEALRLYPPGWLLSRRTIEADVLGGYTVPAGQQRAAAAVPAAPAPAVLAASRSASARSASRPSTKRERPRFAYMPFAAGPRHCIGETFARLRDADAPVQGGAAATACATCPTSRWSSRRRSTCAPATRCTCDWNAGDSTTSRR